MYYFKRLGRDKNRGTDTVTVTESIGSPSDFAAGKTGRGPLNPQDATKASSSQDAPQQQAPRMDQPKTGQRRERIERLVTAYRNHITTYTGLIDKVPLDQSNGYSERLRTIGQAFSQEAQTAATNHSGWTPRGGREVREQAETSMDGGIEQLRALITEMQAAANSQNVESFQEKQKFITNFLQDNKEHPDTDRYEKKYQTIIKRYLPLQKNFTIGAWNQCAEDIQDLHTDITKQIEAEEKLDLQHKREMQWTQEHVRRLLDQIKGPETESTEEAPSLTTPAGIESKDPDQATYQDRWNALENGYGKSSNSDRRQTILHKMTALHKDLIQWHFEKNKAFVQKFLTIPSDPSQDLHQARNQQRYDAIIAQYAKLAPSSSPDQDTHTPMTPDTSIPYQLQDVDAWQDLHNQMKSLHNDLTQQHFHWSQESAHDMLKMFPENEVKTSRTQEYDAIITKYTEMDPVNSIPYQLRDVYHQMTKLCENLMQQQFENTQAWIRGHLEEIKMPDFPTEFRERFTNLQQQYQRASDFDQRLEAQSGMVELHMEVLQWSFNKFKEQIQRIKKNIDDNPYKSFDTIINEYTEMPYRGTIPLDKQQMEYLHNSMMHFHQQQARFLFEKAQGYVRGILPMLAKDSFQATSQKKYDALQMNLEQVSPYQLQEALDNMIALHHDLTRWSFQKSKADIEILLDITQQDGVRTQFQSLESMWNKLESERNDSVHLDGELDIINKLLKVENSLLRIIYKQQTEASINNLLNQFNSSEFKAQFKDLDSKWRSLASSWSDRESGWENLSLEEKKRDNLDQGYTILRNLLHLHNKLAGRTFDLAQERIQQLLPRLAEDTFKEASQAGYKSIIEARPQQEIATDQSSADKMTIRDWQEGERSSQTWQKAVANLLDLHSDLAQEVIKQTHTSVEQLLQLSRTEPPAEFEALTKRCREDLFSPNARSADQSPVDERPIRDWQKNEKNAEAHAHNWQGVVKDLLNFHKELTNRIYQQAQRDIQPLLDQIQDSSRQTQYQQDFDNQQTEYSESTNPGQRQHVLQRMADSHKNLLQYHFEQHHTYIQHLLRHQIKDPQRKIEYQKDLDALQTTYQTSSNPDSQRWQKGKDEIRVLRNTVVDHAWKEVFQQLQAKIDTLLQDLQEDIAEDQYRAEYTKLQKTYDKLSQGGQKLGTSLGAHHCYREMGLFYTKLSGAHEINRQKYELKDDTKEMEHYANEMEVTLQRHMRRDHRVWQTKNGQGQSIRYAEFTDLEGKHHPKEVVEVVEGIDTTTQEAVRGYYCPTTQHFISSDRWTVYDAQLIDDQQLKLTDRRETRWEQELRQWSKPADTKARLTLEEAQKKIWKVLSREDSLASLELTLGFHGSYIAKTTIAGSDADIHVAFNNRLMNNPFYNDLPKYREIMNDALTKAFAPEHVSVYETVTTIAKDAFGTEADVFPAFYHTFEGGHKGLISFTKDKRVVTHFLEQKRHNTQKKSERTAYRSRSVVRIIKNMRKEVSETRLTMPSFIIEALVHNTPNEHFVDYTSEDEPIKRDLAATLDHVLAYWIQHTATKEKCKEWKEVDGIKYLFNLDKNTPWEIELKGVKYTYSGKHDIPREQVHEFLKRLQEYIKKQQEGQFQSIQLSRPLVGTSSS